MADQIQAGEFLAKAKKLPVLDVRSPKEYLQGHIPGAVNLPLFDDEERARVGTLYKNSGRDAAVLKGFELAGPKLAGFVRTLQKLTSQRDILVHCWRGGMRSEHMAWLFEQCGYIAEILAGGYKGYRKFIRDSFSAEPYNIVILGGMTGSGKTEILQRLSRSGEQVLDLEAIACHKGSAFGAMGQEVQPTNEQFENNIYEIWSGFDPAHPVWMEDESRMIGHVTIPDPLFDRMSRAPLIMIEAEREERVTRLVSEYAVFAEADLREAILRISERLGGTRTKQAIQLLQLNDHHEVVRIVLDYYDKSYIHAIEKRIGKVVKKIPVDGKDSDAVGIMIKEFMKSIL